MAALPYMQLEIAKYLADTTHLATVEHGAYMLLIMNYWQRGGALKNSDARLAAICRLTVEEFLRHKDVLSEFFEVTEDEWVHHRIEGDLDSARRRVEGARTAGTASGRQKEWKANGKRTDVQRTFNGRSTGNERTFRIR